MYATALKQLVPTMNGMMILLLLLWLLLWLFVVVVIHGRLISRAMTRHRVDAVAVSMGVHHPRCVARAGPIRS